MPGKGILKQEDSKQIVFDYHPKEFPLVITESASNFVSQQAFQSSDFKISDLVANQVGISQLQKRSLEEKIEIMALDKLKEVEEKAYKEAYELGLIDGAERAFKERSAELHERLANLDQLLASFEVMKQSLVSANEAHLIQLLFQMAKRIAMREIEEDQEGLIKIISDIIESIQTDEKIIVKISTADSMFIESLRERGGKEVEFLKRVKLDSSDEVTPGGCVIETNFGSIDATIEERVSRVWETVKGKIPRQHEVKTDDGS